MKTGHHNSRDPRMYNPYVRKESRSGPEKNMDGCNPHATFSCSAVEEAIKTAITSTEEFERNIAQTIPAYNETYWQTQSHPEFQEGYLYDNAFRKRNNALVVSASAIGTKSYGGARMVYKSYPYGDVDSIKRHANGISIKEDRFIPSDVIVCKPPVPLGGCTDLPVVINAVCQYNYGAEVENNLRCLELLQKRHYGNICSSGDCQDDDSSYVQNLLSDTVLKRLIMFRNCMTKILECVVDVDHIDTVVLPLGIGRRGRVDDIWLRHFYPCIINLNENLTAMNKKCIIAYGTGDNLPDCFRRFCC